MGMNFYRTTIKRPFKCATNSEILLKMPLNIF